MREQTTLEVAWASSREGSNGRPEGHGEQGGGLAHGRLTHRCRVNNGSHQRQKGMKRHID
jgi:hypothetical protein